MSYMTRRVNTRDTTVPTGKRGRGRGNHRAAPRQPRNQAFRAPRRGNGSPWLATTYQPVTFTFVLMSPVQKH